jgi:hypothetical protein
VLSADSPEAEIQRFRGWLQVFAVVIFDSLPSNLAINLLP